MKATAFTYPSANGRMTIHATLWMPEEAPRAILQIAHGITEHIGRFEEVARYFTGLGYAVLGNDHLGHGRSMDADRPLPMYFGGRGSWQYVVDDVYACNRWAKEHFPGLPLVLLGFSLGSFAVRCLLAEHPEAAAAAIWAGTGQMKGAEIAIARLIVRLEEARFGDEKDTPLIHKLTMDSYNGKFRPCRTGADWLCADPEAVDAYLADPLTGEGFTVSSFRELLTGMDISRRDATAAKMNRAMPLLMISGREDPVGGFGAHLTMIREQLGRNGMEDVEVRLFEGMRHDVFHGKGSDQVLDCMRTWMQAKLT